MSRVRESAELKEELVYIERVTSSLEQQGLLPDAMLAVPVPLARGLPRGQAPAR